MPSCNELHLITQIFISPFDNILSPNDNTPAIQTINDIMNTMQAELDTIAEGIANLDHHDATPDDNTPIINDDEAELEADETEIADEESYGGNRATYCPEDDKLRLYVGRVPRDEYLALKAEGWTSTPKQSCDFVAVWTPRRKARAISYAGIIEDEDASPADRAADRAERFAMYRDKRTSEATGHADRYDNGPSAFGYQDKARAVRAADRHDRIATRACDAWSKAEYWTARTAGVISNALHKASASVRLGRIKELELAIARYEGYPAHYGEMLAHLKLRLAYENQMIEAQGGRAACVEMEAGGWLGNHQISKVTRSPVTKNVVSVELQYMSDSNKWGRPWPDGKGSRMVKMLYNIERLPSNAYRAPTDEERAEFDGALKAKRKASAKAAKEKADKGENCPLINPTDEDAERLQAMIYAAYLADWKRRYGEPGNHHKPDAAKPVCRLTQSNYSAFSKGDYSRCETRPLHANAKLPSNSENIYAARSGSKYGPALCKIRVTDYDPYRVIILTDKPQKPLPAKVWAPYTPPAHAEALATITA